MTLDEYQVAAKKTAQYPTIGSSYIYPTLGLAGETGEVVETIKKLERNDGGVVSANTKEKLTKELGDVLWYVSQIATEFGLSLSEIAVENISKLEDRKARGVLHSSGDNR